jgi:general secretion pathway protein C
VLPVMENNRFVGVRLSVGRDSDLLARSGLRSSDVITAVNGIPLDGPQRQVELMNNLRDARQATLTVRRDGQLLQIPVGL